MIINTVQPYHPDTEQLRQSLSEEYDIPVIAMSVESLRETDVYNVLREALFEFPVLEVNVNLPSWVMVLNEGHCCVKVIRNSSRNCEGYKRLRDVDRVVWQFSQYEFIDRASLAALIWARCGGD